MLLINGTFAIGLVYQSSPGCLMQCAGELELWPAGWFTVYARTLAKFNISSALKAEQKFLIMAKFWK